MVSPPISVTSATSPQKFTEPKPKHLRKLLDVSSMDWALSEAVNRDFPLPPLRLRQQAKENILALVRRGEPANTRQTQFLPHWIPATADRHRKAR